MISGNVITAGRKMTYEKIMRERKKYLKDFCTETVSGFLLHNKNYTPEEKREILSIAMKINPVRVDWQTFVMAMREWEKRRKNVER